MTLPWLQETLNRFSQWQQQGRLAHAYLLTGTQGIGKNHLATSMANRLLCANGVACGQCHACKLLAAGTHPDRYQLAADGGQIKVDAVRSLMAPVYGASLLGGAKVVLVEQAHLLNINAANALLKSLEEPPQGTYWLLISSQPGLLLPTILSRCQQLHVPVPTIQQAQQWLAEQGINTTAAMLQRFHGAPLALQAALNAGYADKVTKLQGDLVALETRHLMPETFADRWHKEAIFCLDELSHRLLDQARLARGLAPLYHERLDRQERLNDAALDALWQSVLVSRRQLTEQKAINSKWLLLDIAWQLLEGRSDNVVG